MLQLKLSLTNKSDEKKYIFFGIFYTTLTPQNKSYKNREAL